MTPVTPRMRATIEGGPDGLQIVIPAKRNPIVLVFLGVWLAGWLMGVVDAVGRVGRDLASDPLLLVWLVLWALAGSVAAYTWLWMAIGKERILMGATTLSLRRDVAGVGVTRRYRLTGIRDLRVLPQPAGPLDFGGTARAIGFTGGVIAFEYEGKIVRFGAAIEATEAQVIVERMRQRYAFTERPTPA